ncbi:hypothetical protein M9H77_15106 [Catharanthus roseus]|uniref:Uncharacterized protein n=1 Tax=Catharanthus roseus TaxID=4058 RepID=A0ACC0BQ72_CATRO|nr:hypothetical protein M9H77_15106 [Catharanthus roseus]
MVTQRSCRLEVRTWCTQGTTSHTREKAKNFIKVWIASISSVCYCYSLIKFIKPGIFRLVFLLPIIYLFITLPLSISSFHLGAPTIFYLVWLGNFKLILLAFDRGPLSSQSPLSLLQFISVALLPIKTRSTAPSYLKPRRFQIFGFSALIAVKVVLFGVIVNLYRFTADLNAWFILTLNCFHVYLGVELVLAITAVPVRAILGLEIEPQFNEPYLATSLQDFWGRRWNLMVTSILRPAIYLPVRDLCKRVLGRTYSLAPAIMATFFVSGLMHEIIYYYVTRESPTWEVTSFFVLHGFAVCCEIALKKALNGRWRIHRAVSGPATLGFVAVTGSWLFFPQVIRNGVDQKAINEYGIMVRFVRDRLMMISPPTIKETT